jgi:hypothetical protein
LVISLGLGLGLWLELGLVRVRVRKGLGKLGLLRVRDRIVDYG